VLIDYNIGNPTGPDPYAQAALVDGLWHCEVVSGRYLIPARWPLNELWLKRFGWSLSAQGFANWFLSASTAQVAAVILVEGLRFGRQCVDPARFGVSVQSFAGGSGPNGGGSRLGMDLPSGCLVAA